jgi:hypothetical protein
MADAFDNQAKLAELAIRRFDTRRAYEWKVLLGFWAAMLAAYSPAWSVYKPHWAIVVIAAVGFIVFWISGVWIANYNDKARYEYHLQLAERIADRYSAFRKYDCSNYPGKKHRCDLLKSKLITSFFGDWNVQFQIVGTAIIATLLITSQFDIQQEIKGHRIRSIGSLEHTNERTRSFGWLDIQQRNE